MKRTEFQLVFVINCQLKCSRSAWNTPGHFPWYFYPRREEKSLMNFKDVLSVFVFVFFLFRWWQMVPIAAVNNFEDCCIHQKLVISDRYTCLRNFLRFYSIWLLVIYNWEVLKVFISFFSFFRLFSEISASRRTFHLIVCRVWRPCSWMNRKRAFLTTLLSYGNAYTFCNLDQF